jgi:hypothetical protein
MHDTMGVTPASSLFGRRLWLLNNLLFGTPRVKEWPTIEHAANLVDHLHDIHNYAHKHLQLASNRMKTWYNKLANCVGYQEGKGVCLYRLNCTMGKPPKQKSSWDGPYIVITWINDVIYRIQRNSTSRMMVVHLDRLAPYRRATLDEQPYGGSSRSGWRVATERT